jgi:hypothetical protein
VVTHDSTCRKGNIGPLHKRLQPLPCHLDFIVGLTEGLPTWYQSRGIEFNPSVIHFLLHIISPSLVRSPYDELC